MSTPDERRSGLFCAVCGDGEDAKFSVSVSVSAVVRFQFLAHDGLKVALLGKSNTSTAFAGPYSLSQKGRIVARSLASCPW